MSNEKAFSVAVGDIYRDKDPRMSDRLVKVKSEDGRHAYVIGCTEEGEEIGRRTRVSLAGLESRFERVGGSTVKADLERAVIDAAQEWRDADREWMKVFESTSADRESKLEAATVRFENAAAALRKSVDALRPEPAAGTAQGV